MNNFDISIFVKYAESFIVSALFILVGYLLNAHDPCFLESKLNISLFFIAILTLFFGWGGLLPFLVIYTLAMNIFYDTFDIYHILELTLLGLVLYLFQYVWHTKTKEQKVKEEYLNQKLNENTNAFYILKASYDKLEKAYITKPFSLKDSLQKIINIANNSGKEIEFLKLLSQIYQVKKSIIVTYEKDKDTRVYSSDQNNSFDKNDPLIKRAIEEKAPVYIDFNDESNQTKYLIVIPVILDSQKEISLLIIEDILFTSFNKDTLLEISVIFTYFLQSLNKNRFMELNNCTRPYLSDDFAFELCKLKDIEKIYNIPSSVITFKSTSHDYIQNLLSLIKKEKRAIEMIQTLRVDDKNYAIIILFPFSNRSSVEGFFKRLKNSLHKDRNLLKHIESKDFIYKIGDIKKNKIENLLG